MTKSINAHVLQFIEKVLHTAPVNWRQIFKSCNIDEDVLQNPDQFISLEMIERIFNLALEETGDDYLVVRHFDHRRCYFKPTLFDGLLSLSANMRELKNLFHHYNQMQNHGAFHMSAEEKNGFGLLQIDVHANHNVRLQYADLLMLHVHWMVNELSGEGFRARRLDLVRQSVDETLYSRHFGAIEIHKGMPQLTLWVDPEVYQRRFRQRQGHLLQAMKLSADEKLRVQGKSSSFIQKVRDVIINNIGTNGLSSSEVARQMGMSRSSLHRYLADHETTYQKFFDEIRLENAQRFLLESSMETWEISSMLGFSADSSFRRFFKSQTKTTPRRYRKIHQTTLMRNI